MKNTKFKEKIVGNPKGIKLIINEDDYNLTIKSIFNQNEISESDVKNALGIFLNSLDKIRKIEDFENIPANQESKKINKVINYLKN